MAVLSHSLRRRLRAAASSCLQLPAVHVLGAKLARRAARKVVTGIVDSRGKRAYCWTEFRSHGVHENVRHAVLLAESSSILPVPRELVPAWTWLPDRLRGLVRHAAQLVDNVFFEPAIIDEIQRCMPDSGLVVTSGSLHQIPRFSGRIVLDHDDPVLDEASTSLINADNVAGVIVTTAALRESLIRMGLDRPCVVVPSGVPENLTIIGKSRLERAEKSPDEAPPPLAVGYTVPELFLDSDFPDAESEQFRLRSISYLLEAMQVVWDSEPDTRLVLVGTPSSGVRAVADSHPTIELRGYVPHSELGSVYREIDIGVYPRPFDFGGRASIKLLEYMAVAVPIVATEVAESYFASEVGAAVLASSSESFGVELVRLIRDGALRTEMGSRGHAAALARTWPEVARQFEAIVAGGNRAFAANLRAEGTRYGDR